MKKLNLPNKLTLARVLLVPFFVAFLLVEFGNGANRWIALAIFILASLTDLLDGYIARRDHLITNLGKFMDPLADKLLVSSALICLVGQGKAPAWMVAVIIGRDFIISGLREVAADNGRVIAASYWGKFKTTFQMVMICLMIADLEPLRLVTRIVMWAAFALTVVSLVDYMVKNRDVLAEAPQDDR